MAAGDVVVVRYEAVWRAWYAGDAPDVDPDELRVRRERLLTERGTFTARDRERPVRCPASLRGNGHLGVHRRSA